MSREPSTSRLMKQPDSHIENASSESCLQTLRLWNSATSLCHFKSQFLERCHKFTGQYRGFGKLS